MTTETQKTDEDVTTDEVEVTEEEPFVPLPLEAMTHFQTPEGIPVFVANYAGITQHIEAHGYQIYYLISYKKEEVKNGAVTKSVYRPVIWRVMNSIISRSIVEVDENEVALDVHQESAQFTLPKIPNTLRQRLDDFFRLIADQHGTEAIVLLTYDSTATGPEGWGVLVPEQKNTGAHCAYDQESVIADKPDHVYIVGSAHSHPGMRAYASGTDHNDQADFDGLHVTYGWSSQTGGQTEYHAELQISGTGWKIPPEVIFEEIPRAPVDEEVHEWSEKVTKASYTAPKATGSASTTTTTTTGTGTPVTSSGSPTHQIKVPSGCPDIKKNIVIAMVGKDEKQCPFCESNLIPHDIEKRRCLACHQYLALDGETVQDLVTARTKKQAYTYDIDITKPQSVVQPIYMWTRDSNGTNLYQEVFTPDASGGDSGKK